MFIYFTYFFTTLAHAINKCVSKLIKQYESKTCRYNNSAQSWIIYYMVYAAQRILIPLLKLSAFLFSIFILLLKACVKNIDEGDTNI